MIPPPKEECWKEPGTAPIGTRWVDVNKGDDDKPEYRSRLVAKEIKTNKREDLFAATPPHDASQLLNHLCPTPGPKFYQGLVLMQKSETNGISEILEVLKTLAISETLDMSLEIL